MNDKSVCQELNILQQDELKSNSVEVQIIDHETADHEGKMQTSQSAAESPENLLEKS
jgi:hypothetical protein